MITDERKEELSKYVREGAASMIYPAGQSIPAEVLPGLGLPEEEHAYIARCCHDIAAMIADNGARLARVEAQRDDTKDELQLSYAEHGKTMHERDSLLHDVALALGWCPEFAAGEHPAGSENPITPRLIVDGVENLARSRKAAQVLLKHIGNARFNFSVDSGGPANPAEGMVVIEGWISNYFKADVLALTGDALATDGRSRGDLLAEPRTGKARP